MSTPSAVRVRQLSKCYRIVHQERATTLGEAVATRLRHPLRRHPREEFWALRDVSFDVARGEVVGIIGRNGAGKSTLLKILSRIVSPTTGEIALHGRVGSLLEVGTGFHPELTGRENIFLNGAILGMRHREIERHFDAIVDFAGVEKFLDTPVKRYSSGMYVRLAFAVAAHLSSDILIIDEVLAVGDAEFQKKCLGKMQNIANDEGRTILFVSHSMTSVQSLCQRCVLLHRGEVAFDGRSKEASENYLRLLQEQSLSDRSDSNQPVDNGEFDLSFHENTYQKISFLEKVKIFDAQGRITNQIGMGETIVVTVDVRNAHEHSAPELLISIKSQDGSLLSYAATHMKPPIKLQVPSPKDRYTFYLPRLPFTPGIYHLDFLLRARQSGRTIKLDRASNIVQIEIYPRDVLDSGFEYSDRDGYIYLDMNWQRTSQI